MMIFLENMTPLVDLFIHFMIIFMALTWTVVKYTIQFASVIGIWNLK